MPRLSDTQLIIILKKAARRINRLLCLFDTADEITVANDGCVTPADGALEDLVLLQAECMVAQRSYMEFISGDSSSAGVLVKDGEQSIDTRDAGSSIASAFSSSLNPCEELKAQLAAEQMKRCGGADGPGKCVW